KSLLSSVDAPQFNTIYDFTVTRVIYHKDGNPFLLKGYIGVGSNNIAGTVHVSGIVGDTKADRDCRFNHEIGFGDQLAVEILEKSSEGYRFS
ncbi:hypothetical protein, partial [Pseudomonas sp. P14-2025]|uniref:hypothetical protein n=1 Tax=Pseudomonas sp. P14-2025 TaxID=3421169 RepID=UPI003FA3CE56